MSDVREYRTVDKSEWGDGPWQDEPDKIQWQDKATRYPCLIVRGPSGALCGYVGVTEGHPAFARGYSELPAPVGSDDDYWPSVHGGLTFAAFCAHGPDESRGICHVPAPGEPDRVWWLGFDCAHAGDETPSYSRRSAGYGYDEHYRDVDYVRREVAGLAAQLHDLAKKGPQP